MGKYKAIRGIFLTLILLTLLLNFMHIISWWIGALIVLTYISLMFYHSMNIQANFFLKAMHQTPNDKVMLTFDDGPDPEHTPQVLKILKKNKVSAFFFLIGEKAEMYPEIVERIITEGHQIGGHSYHHQKWFGMMGRRKVDKEIMSTQRALSDFVEHPVHWFRPPFGVTNPAIARSVKQNQLQTIGWNVRSFDTAISDSDLLEQRVCAQMKPGSIILMHDRLPQTVKALPGILAYAKEKGLEFDVIRESENVI